MTRSKVKLALIKNNTERKASYKKRQKGYMKKVQELSTLCDVETATVIYSPYHDEPMVFPNHAAVINTFIMFRELPELEQSRNMMTLKDFTNKRIKKLEDQLRKVRKENRVKEFTNMMYEVLNGKDIPADIEPYDLNDLSYVINQNLKWVREAKKVKTSGEGSSSNTLQPIAGPMVSGETISEVLSYPLLDHPVDPLLVVPPIVFGRTSFEGPMAPLLVPNVSPISVVPPMNPYVLPLSDPTQVPQLMFQPVAPPQTVPLVGLLRVPPPHSPSFFSQMLAPMVSQLYSPIPQQTTLVRASEMAPSMPPNTMDSSMTPPIDPSLNVPLMGATISMNDYQSNSNGSPESHGFAEILNCNNDDLVTLCDDLSFNNINVQDPSHNNNNYF